MAPFAFLPMQYPKLEFTVEYAKLSKPAKEGEEMEILIETQKLSTKNSKKPHPSDANFLELLELDVKLPENPLFAPALKITAIDERLGGFLKPVVGTGAVPLEPKCFWGDNFEPMNMEFFDMEAGNADDLADEDATKEMTEEEKEAALAKKAARSGNRCVFALLLTGVPSPCPPRSRRRPAMRAIGSSKTFDQRGKCGSC